tara:strand:- start:75 stop:242 length:168 start_codon:yes stop_codon:yes gene_type:complete
MAQAFFDGLVSFLSGRSNNVHREILTYAKTEYKNDWKYQYQKLSEQFERTGKWGK